MTETPRYPHPKRGILSFFLWKLDSHLQGCSTLFPEICGAQEAASFPEMAVMFALAEKEDSGKRDVGSLQNTLPFKWNKIMTF